MMVVLKAYLKISPRFGLNSILLFSLLCTFPKLVHAACDITINALPYTANQSGKTYCLANNFSSGVLTVAADNLTIDGQNFSITTDLNLDGRMGVRITRLITSGGFGIQYGGNNEISQCTASSMGILNSRGNSLIGNTINTSAAWPFTVDGNSDSKIYARDNLIRNNTIIGNGSSDARFFHTSYAFNNNFIDNNVQLLNSVNGSSLITMYYSHYNTLSHNSFRHTVVSGQGEGGSYMRDQSSYNTFEFNTVEDNYRALGLSSGNEIGFSRFNLFHGNVLKGGNYVIFLQAGDGTNYYRYNLIQASSGQAALTGGISDNDGVEFTNNTFISPQGQAIWSDGLSATRHYTLKNNIFVTSNQPNFSLPGNINLTSNYNLFARKASGTLIDFGAPYTSLAAWQATGRDAQSVSYAPGATPAPSIFLDEANGDYHLSAASIARNKGEAGVDLGALPYSAASCSPDWRCGNWGACSGNQRTRSCQDRNNCGISQGAPPTSMSCQSATFSASCTPSWVCSAWGLCGDVYKYRHCGDLNACEKIENMPTQYQDCSASCEPNWSCTAWSACNAGTQTRSCSDNNSCGAQRVPTPATSRKCIYTGAIAGIDALAPGAPANLRLN